ncbi:vitamin B12 ABC transporter ATP-binding protein BtuD [Erwiniaceae bacterium BAC15a-03b]|uniref:Vitamin B12 import ATP-binding protein BtuD n=1 Tax=Winslowiella arboricola TaxID=2978220 RepID=A0A9J6PTX1_9GAMM|nr:vitamin B12 ABC transporter ATP-binding protein BtuD [Winslowiella arboricola]MCU5774933.1 vitamin B12 ABC transporter ATP-binding protein BtuD [Winslowiella arboricola]MCU5779915.1 vitamin B12 ABC transporter ATP-binding protein BtuD [Winslowiella arboricola]
MLLDIDGAALAGRLAPFSAQVTPGQLIHLLGPNGAGKSSLLARLSGLLPGSGRIQFLDKPLEIWSGQQLARHRGWLHQQQLPPGLMAVFHYLQQHLQYADQSCDTVLAHILAELQLTDKLARPLNQLSGGEWQRVRLAAVLLQITPQANSHGKLLLLDEPMAGLDVAQQAALDRLLLAQCQAGVTVIMSGHDLNHSLRHAQQVWLLKGGAVIAQGATQQVMQPEQLEQLYQVPFRKLTVEGHQILTTLVD